MSSKNILRKNDVIGPQIANICWPNVGNFTHGRAMVGITNETLAQRCNNGGITTVGLSTLLQRWYDNVNITRVKESDGPTMAHVRNTKQRKGVGILTLAKRLCANTLSHIWYNALPYVVITMELQLLDSQRCNNVGRITLIWHM